MRDRIFQQDICKQFEFDAQVASVFDDMISRSVPYYKDIMNLIVDFCSFYFENKECLIYDLGSSTGSLLLMLSLKLKNARLIGIDNSQAMINQAQLKAKAYNKNISFVCEDLLESSLDSNDCVIANYILQFIRPLNRQNLLNNIYQSLKKDGIFIMSEKMSSANKILDRQMIDSYTRYKLSQGYTQTEISKKREALENVLVPFSMQENILMLQNAGFKHIEVLFKWVNFGTLLAIKD